MQSKLFTRWFSCLPAAPILVLAASCFFLFTSASAQAQQPAETVLHAFHDGSVADDGMGPLTALVQGSDGNFYGTTYGGGTTAAAGQNSGTGYGTAFKVTPAGIVTILHSFHDGSVANDGEFPQATLIEGSDGNFYGTTTGGGSAGYGTAFKMTPSGTVTILHSFHDGSVSNDGMQPYAALLQASNGSFYGTTNGGGSAGYGAVFKITPSGTVTIVHSFHDGSVANDGINPFAALIQGRDGNFYGTTYVGGSTATAGDNGGWGYGTVFRMTPAGAITILHSFGDGSVANDGEVLPAALVQGSDGNFYGTTKNGGSTVKAGDAGGWGFGIVFKMTPTGVVTILHSFGDGSVADDGLAPNDALIIGRDGNFYGTAEYGGSTATPGDTAATGNGALFKMTPAGAVTILHSFGDGTVVDDGVTPWAALIEGSDGNFYGTTRSGGSGQGSVFRLDRSPSRFDLFGDGRDSLLWENNSTGQLVAWDMSGVNSSRSTGVFHTVSPVWKVMGVADINSDGHPDLLWWNSKTGQMLFWEMTGTPDTSVLSYGSVFGDAPPNWQPVSMADFKANGHPDILLENTSTGQLVVWYMKGQSVDSSSGVFATLPANWRVAGTADFDGDGHPDILCENTKTGAVFVWYMGGPGGTTLKTGGSTFATVANTAWRVVSTGDTNADGHPDLTWHNSATGQTLVWLMGGSLGTTIESIGAPLAATPPTAWNVVGVR